MKYSFFLIIDVHNVSAKQAFYKQNNFCDVYLGEVLQKGDFTVSYWLC